MTNIYKVGSCNRSIFCATPSQSSVHFCHQPSTQAFLSRLPIWREIFREPRDKAVLPCKQTRWQRLLTMSTKSCRCLDASEIITLNDAERVKLIAVMKEKKCLWGREKNRRAEKQAALKELEEAFDSLHISSELLSVWKSLRASMLRVVEKMRKEP